jgi:TolB-like protein/DNA-binding winged helix-turn-helix (wHTH) protein/tetratricopeptide (TPR) repeat protein
MAIRVGDHHVGVRPQGSSAAYKSFLRNPQLDAPAEKNRYFEFDDYRLEPGQCRLTRLSDGQALAVTGRAFEALCLLVERHGQLIEKSTLMQALWPRVVVEDANLTQTIYTLRQLLGETPTDRRFIVTVPGRGYRWVADVREFPKIAPTLPAAAPAPQPSEGLKVGRVAAFGGGALAVLLVGAATGWIWLHAHWDPPPVSIARAGPSVAILPFENLTGDPGKDFWGDGMAEELIKTLGDIPALKVVARSSSFAYRGRNVDARQIGKDLGVSMIVEGSVRSVGDRIRITAQLSDATTGFRIWSDSFDRKMTDLFQLQDDLALAVEKAMNLTLTSGEAVALTRAPPTQDVLAYTLSLQGFAIIDRGIIDGADFSSTTRAIGLFDQAIARDPHYARPHLGKAIVFLASTYVTDDFKAGREAAAREVATAVALDQGADNIAVTESLSATLAEASGDELAAWQHYVRAIELNPGDPNVRLSYADALAEWGYLREALTQATQAYSEAPTNPRMAADLAAQYANSGEDEQALHYADLAERLGAQGGAVLWPRSAVAADAHRYEESLQLLQEGMPPGANVKTAVDVIRSAIAALKNPRLLPAARMVRRRLYPRGAQFHNLMEASACCIAAGSFTALHDFDTAYDLANQCLDQVPPGLAAADAFADGGIWSPTGGDFRRDPRFVPYIDRANLRALFEKKGPPDECDLKDGALTCH